MEKKQKYDARVMVPESFREECKRQKLSYGNLFEKVWNSYQTDRSMRRIEHQDICERAAQKLGIDETAFNERAAVYYASVVTGEHVMNKEFSKHRLDSNERLSIVVQGIIEKNEQAENWWEKVRISPYVIRQYILENKKELGFTSLNQTVVNRLDELYGKVLEAHYKKHEIEEDHNKKAAAYIRQHRADK